ncbi:MAG TPA: stage V sporulation protein AE [Bacillales bacterium]|nr:stage V sporulation protein AE [Bacillales bacterium]
MERKRVIFITDGDLYARKAVEHVAKVIGGRCISRSAGNPTPLSGKEIVQSIRETPYDPVLVMVDDCGFRGVGYGEQAMRYIHGQPDIDVIGAVAVASNTGHEEWSRIDVSVDRFGDVTEHGVDKEGIEALEDGRVDGDTVYVLDELCLPVVVGVGDIGKMDGRDAVEQGCPITLAAVRWIMQRDRKQNGCK